MRQIVLSAVPIIMCIFYLYLIHKARKQLYQDVKTLYSSIARDLNSVTRTIALYAGADPPGQTPGEGAPGPETTDPVELARRKAELWRMARRGGARR